MNELRINNYINLTNENLEKEHISCLIRSKNTNKGICAKKAWLKRRISKGHVFRKLDVLGTAFIEYALVEEAFVPIIGDNYIYIYCLFVEPKFKGLGYASDLLNYCINEARKAGKSGVCMLGSNPQKAWLSDTSFMIHHNFEVVDEIGEYMLLAKSFDGTIPSFTDSARRFKIDEKGLTIYYSDQCPYTLNLLPKVKSYCDEHLVFLKLIHVDNLELAKGLPCVFNNLAVFYKGRFQTLNQIDKSFIERLIKKEGGAL